jgi:hypothetical protein
MTERIATLEAIAFGADADVRPIDRLRALELLEGVPSVDAALLKLTQELTEMSDEKLDAELDAMTAARLEAILADTAERKAAPRTTAVLHSAIERRVRAAAGLALTSDER